MTAYFPSDPFWMGNNNILMAASPAWVYISLKNKSNINSADIFVEKQCKLASFATHIILSLKKVSMYQINSFCILFFFCLPFVSFLMPFDCLQMLYLQIAQGRLRRYSIKIWFKSVSEYWEQNKVSLKHGIRSLLKSSNNITKLCPIWRNRTIILDPPCSKLSSTAGVRLPLSMTCWPYLLLSQTAVLIENL